MRDDELVDLQRLRLALGVGPGHADALLADLDLADLDAELDLQALLGEGLQRLLGDLLVTAARKVGSASSTVTSAPRRRHTEPISRPMTPEPIRPSFFGTAPMRSAPSLLRMFLLVERRTRQGARAGAGGHDDLLAGQRDSPLTATIS
jgi:hypothetical protein